jgi:RHS repeat-associated protein
MSGAGTLTTASTYDAGNRIQTAISATETNAYTFDAAGRLVGQLVNGQPRLHTYSFRSQMTGLTDTNTAASTYAFDGDQNRIVEAGTAGPAVRMVYDGPNVVLDLESGIVKAAYIHSLGIDQPIERIQFIAGVPDGRHVYHTDALGSVWVMTDDIQVVAKSYAYEAFGRIRSESGSGLLFPNRYTYTARESLGDTLGHYYYRARVMDPRLGRFTSEDPLGFVDGFSLAVYVGNRPVGWIDGGGHAKSKPGFLKPKKPIKPPKPIDPPSSDDGFPSYDANNPCFENLKKDYETLLNCKVEGDPYNTCIFLCECLAGESGQLNVVNCAKKCTDAYLKRCKDQACLFK